MKAELLNFCKSLNIEYAGIAPVGPYNSLAEIWQKRVSVGHITGFEESNFSLRIDPTLTMKSARSIIVCLFTYFTGSKAASNLSKSSQSIDYHLIIKNKLEQITAFLNSKIPDFEYKAYVDNGPLVDRHLAYLAGLGYYGINSHIITDKYGSYVFIGYIINNYDFEPDQPLEKTCAKCGECVRRCPGFAILGDFNINPLACKSYITQKKGDLSDQEIEILGKSPLVFGCDICQDVCPHNAQAVHTPMKEFTEDIKDSIDCEELRAISNKEFIRRYKDRAFSWRGKSILIRNSDIISKRLSKGL